jgi:hypothetical protein
MGCLIRHSGINVQVAAVETRIMTNNFCLLSNMLCGGSGGATGCSSAGADADDLVVLESTGFVVL